MHSNCCKTIHFVFYMPPKSNSRTPLKCTKFYYKITIHVLILLCTKKNKLFFYSNNHYLMPSILKLACLLSRYTYKGLFRRHLQSILPSIIANKGESWIVYMRLFFTFLSSILNRGNAYALRIDCPLHSWKMMIHLIYIKL